MAIRNLHDASRELRLIQASLEEIRTAIIKDRDTSREDEVSGPRLARVDPNGLLLLAKGKRRIDEFEQLVYNLGWAHDV